MKKLHLLGAALVALSMTACSEESMTGNEEPVTPPTVTPVGDGGYIAVKITNPANSRADVGDSMTFPTGSEDENKIDINNLGFFFYKADGTPFDMTTGTNVNGNPITSNMIRPMYAGNGSSDVSLSSAVLVLGKAAGEGYEGAIPAKMICVANADDITVYQGKTLTEVESIIEEAVVTTSKNGSFVMTSSAYWANNQKTFWSEITSANIKSTPADAKAAPVQLYVERMAAKVQVASVTNGLVQVAGENNTTTPFALTYLDWDATANDVKSVTGKNVWAEFSGWNVNTLANKASGIKTISNYSAGDNKYFDNLTDWNSAERHRCFWATTNSQIDAVNSIKPEQFKATATENDEQTLWRGAGADNARYIFANTSDPFLLGVTNRGNEKFRGKQNFARSRATKLLVGVNLSIVDAGATAKSETPFNLLHWGGTYYTPAALCNSIAKLYGLTGGKKVVMVRANDPNGTKQENDYKQHFNVNFYWVESNSTHQMGDLVASDQVDATNHAIDPTLYAAYWNGMAYYIVNIANDLKATAQSNKEMYGVVRNHIYSYTLQKFIGLGTPVAAPDQLTDVENPASGETFVAAQLNIVPWRLVEHETDLE